MALAACQRGEDARIDAGASARSAAQVREGLRDDARLILEQHCGVCHVRDSPGAVPGALAVYDLREPEWSARMSDAQLRSATWRLGEPLPPDGATGTVTPEERARFERYVDAEIVRRSTR
jgi:hypothetical protein